MQAATWATSLTPGTRSSRAISEACSDRQPAQRTAGRPGREQPGLEHRLGQLLHEQRHPVGPAGDLAQHRRGSALPPATSRDDRLGRAAAEAVER